LNKATSFLLVCNLKIRNLNEMFCSVCIQMFRLLSIMGYYVSFPVELRTVFFRRMRTNPTTVLTIYEYILISLSIFNYTYAMFHYI